MPPKVYVGFRQFSATAANLRASVLANCAALVIVNIAPTRLETAYRSPGLKENILRYNEALASVCDERHVHLVDVFSRIQRCGVEKMILDDGIHLTAEGNAFLAGILYEKLLYAINCLREEGNS
jgi:lysophospholipase L1-like esterase